MSKELGLKSDEGKLLFTYFTQGLAPVIKGIVAVLTYGAQKYKKDSWQYVPNGRQRYLDAFERHMSEINLGQQYDLESGLPHIFHAICNLMFVAWFDIPVLPNKYNFNKPPETK